MADLKRQFTDRVMHASMDAAVTPACWILAVFYGVLVGAHILSLTGQVAVVMAVLAALTAATFVSAALGWERWRDRADPSTLLGTLSVLVGLNTWLHFWLIPEASNTANFIVWAMGNGFVLLSRPWFYTLTIVNIVSWLGVVVLAPVAPLDNWGWFLAAAVLVSVLFNLQRHYSIIGIARREAQTTRRDELLQSIVSAPELFEADNTKLLQRVCEVACDELGIRRFGIWIASDDRLTLKRIMLWDQDALQDEPVEVTHADMPEFFDQAMNSPTVSLEAVNDQPDLARTLTKIGMEIGPRGLLVSTIKMGGQVIGVTTAVANSPRHWSVEDKAFAASLANVVAISLQHDQTLQLEKRAQQAERLESLGILAGGVAHDFNNLLAVIMGHAELLSLKAGDADPSKPALTAILDASARARDLSQQMLAYAGRAAFDKRSTDLAGFVGDAAGSIAREFLGDAKLILTISNSETLRVEVDTTQIRQVLLNLLVNARNANARRIEVSVGSDMLEETPAGGAIELEQLPGRYHWIEVSDDGSGMDEHTVQRIFDPFFSTRVEGTGLGLAAVLGILRAHKGTIAVRSKPGVGTTIRIHLPQSANSIEELENLSQGPVARQPGAERIVLVEDEPLVRNMTKKLLEQGGNEVFAFDSLDATKRFLDSHPDAGFQFAVLDLTLRDESGMDVLKYLRAYQPGLPTVIMSGYDAMDALSGYADEATVVFLQKPYSQQQLWTAIKSAKALSEGGVAQSKVNP